MDRKNFTVEAAIGQPYGTVWEVQNDTIVKIQPDLPEIKTIETGKMILYFIKLYELAGSLRYTQASAR